MGSEEKWRIRRGTSFFEAVGFFVASFVVLAVIWVAVRKLTGGGAAENPNEITANPAVLCDDGFRASQATVFGMRLGDPRSKFPTQITATWGIGGPDTGQDPRGVCWFFGNPRRDTITEIGLRPPIIKGLGINSRQDIEGRLGKADRVVKDTSGWMYCYDQKDIRVYWSADEGLSIIWLGRRD